VEWRFGQKNKKLRNGDKDCDIILWSVVMEEFWIGGSNSLNFEINNIERKFIIEKLLSIVPWNNLTLLIFIFS
jgi:hypothetical protein